MVREPISRVEELSRLTMEPEELMVAPAKLREAEPVVVMARVPRALKVAEPAITFWSVVREMVPPGAEGERKRVGSILIEADGKERSMVEPVLPWKAMPGLPPLVDANDAGRERVPPED